MPQFESEPFQPVKLLILKKIEHYFQILFLKNFFKKNIHLYSPKIMAHEKSSELRWLIFVSLSSVFSLF